MKQRSLIWKESKEDFQLRVSNSSSIAEILRSLNMSIGADNYKAVKRRVSLEGIDMSHIQLGLNCNKGRKFPSDPQNIHKHLVFGSIITSNSLKIRLFKEGLIENKCSKCGLPPIWCGERISLHLDHINGIRNDNRIENLRILCPNCHSQTPTFGNKTREPLPKHTCTDCEIRITKTSLKCRKCANQRPQPQKFTISKEDLTNLVWTIPTSDIAKLYNVSCKAIEKRCKKFGIPKPARGYWQKLKSQQSNSLN